MKILNNKGMFLETLLNYWCKKINDTNFGFVTKMAVDYHIVEINESILKGVIKTNDNCDYIGIYQGKYIEFEAKETELDYFSINNIKNHQLRKLEKIVTLGGLAFVVVYFHLHDQCFLIPIETIKGFQKNKIPFSWFEENGILINQNGFDLQLEQKITLIT